MKLDTLGDLFVRFICHLYHLALTSLAGASMTLVGLLPPLCHKGSMLVDGGYSKCYLLDQVFYDDVSYASRQSSRTHTSHRVHVSSQYVSRSLL